MSTVIKVENLSKRYRLGLKESRKDTLMGQIAQTLRAPLDNLKRLRSMTRFEEEDESVFWALRDINFEVKQGEVLGIIGHNGAGKSTLLKILSRITEPTNGRILINGRIAALLEVGTGFHQDLTGRENIYMNGTILGMTRKEIDRKLDEIVDFSGVEKHLDTPVKFYSSGMKVRLGFAVAAHLEPEILIIDEVLAVGDAEFQKKCLGKMESVAGEGRTVLFVSHDMGAVTSLCPKSMLLKGGRIQSIGLSSETIDKYLSGGIIEGEIKIDTDEMTLNEVQISILEHSMEVIMDYEVKYDIKDMFLGFSVRNKQGNKLFTTYDLENNSSTFRKKGQYRSKYTVQTDFFPPGAYFISLHVMIHRKKWILKESALMKIEVPYKVNIHGLDTEGILVSPGIWQIS